MTPEQREERIDAIAGKLEVHLLKHPTASTAALLGSTAQFLIGCIVDLEAQVEEVRAKCLTEEERKG